MSRRKPEDLTAAEHHKLDLLIDCPDCGKPVGKNCIIDGKTSRYKVHGRRRMWRLLRAAEILN